VTGPIPAEYDQSQVIGKDIQWVELFTVLAIALIVGLRFRSAGAPLATLTCAGTAYVLAVRVVAWLAQRMGVTLPPDLDPVLVVLLLTGINYAGTRQGATWVTFSSVGVMYVYTANSPPKPTAITDSVSQTCKRLNTPSSRRGVAPPA